MDIFERNPIRSLDDFVFHDECIKQKIETMFLAKSAKNTLFHGPAGTGKSTVSEMLAKEFVGVGKAADVLTINVPLNPSRTVLCQKIENFAGFGKFNQLGKCVVILEELDGASAEAQRALKVLLDQQAEHKLFFATTNCLGEIIDPIRDRFDLVYLQRSTPEQWQARAKQVLQNEGIQYTEAMTAHLIKTQARTMSGRDIMQTLDDFAQVTKLIS